MNILNIVFPWVLFSSVTASLILLFVLCIKGFFGKRIGIRLHQALWLLVLIRLLVPIVPESPVSLLNLLPEKLQDTSKDPGKNMLPGSLSSTYAFIKERQLHREADGSGSLPYAMESSGAENGTRPAVLPGGEENSGQNLRLFTQQRIFKMASLIWLSGFLLLSLALLGSAVKFQAKVRKLQTASDPELRMLLDICRKKTGINKEIPVYFIPSGRSPFISGILFPKIIVPADLYRRIGSAQLSYILLHELAHYKRRDVLFNLLGSVAVMIHWFNPLVWFAAKQMKLDRELACDACVLEILGEKERISYGETILDLSRFSAPGRGQVRLANFYETKHQIERRINRIGMFKKGSYRISAAAVAFCIVAGAATLTNAVDSGDRLAGAAAGGPYPSGIENSLETEKESVKKETAIFLIDAAVKMYNNIQKVEKVSGFPFKVPDYIPAGYASSGWFNMAKTSGGSHAVILYFVDSRSNINYSFYASAENLLDFLKENAGKQFMFPADRDIKLEADTEALSLGNTAGFNVTIKASGSEPGFMETTKKYYVWQDREIWYGLLYNEAFRGSKGNVSVFSDLPLEEVEKSVLSIVYPGELRHSSYPAAKPDLSTEVGQFCIYDAEDLTEAEKLLGFAPKFPLRLAGNLSASFAGVTISPDSDIKNNLIYYQFNLFYDLEKAPGMTFTQAKTLKLYEDIKKNGYFEQEEYRDGKRSIKRVGARLSTIDGLPVFVFENKYQPDDPGGKEYVWKENDLYFRVSFQGTVENPEEVLQQLINEKKFNQP